MLANQQKCVISFTSVFGLKHYRYILDHPEIVRGLRVLDLGSGCGATAIAAALAGAKSVTANDIDPGR